MALPTVGDSREAAKPSTPSRIEKAKPAASVLVQPILNDTFLVPMTMMKETMEAECVSKLMAKEDDAFIPTFNPDGTIRYGNPEGLSLLDRSAAAIEDMKLLKEEVKSRGIQIEDLEVKVNELKVEVNELRIDRDNARSELRIFKGIKNSFISIRSRFLSKYLRDTNNMGPDGQSVIDEGDYAVRHGDAYTDAVLYKNKIRTDLITFKELYGIVPRLVLEYLSTDDEETHKTLRVLNTHATTIAGKDWWSPGRSFSRSFNHFIVEWEHGGYRTDYLQDSNAPETKAYRNFWSEFEKFPKGPISGESHERDSVQLV